MSITINVTPTTGGSFTAAGVESGNITLTVGGGIGPPGAGNVALAAGDGITISSTNNVATITSTVQGVPASNLADLADVDATAPTSGQVLEWNGTAWAPGIDSTLTLASTGGSDLGASTAGTSSEAARADHVHNLPALADLVGVSLGTPSTGQVLAYNGTAWAPTADNALTLSSDAGADLGTAAAGSAGVAARADHVHNLPTFAEITNGTASVTGNLTLNASTGGVIVNGGTSPGSLTLNCEQNTHGITIASPAHAAGASYTLTLPATAGSANQVLTTDGSGSLSWSTGGSGGGISWSSVPTDSNANGTAGQVAYDSQGYFYLHDGTSWRRIQLATFGVVPTTRLLAENGDSLLSETGDYISHDGNPAYVFITVQPQNATTSGATASFSVSAYATDTSTVTYQWQEFTGTVWANISAATSSTLSLGGLTSSDNGNQYRVNVGSDTAATVTSDVATLTVATGTAWSQVGGDIDGASASNQLGYGVALASNGSTLFVAEDQSVRLYTDNGTAWIEDGNSPFLFGGVMSPSNVADTVLASSEDGLTFIAAGGANSYNMATVNQYSGGSWSSFSHYESGYGPKRSSVAISRDGQYAVLAARIEGGTAFNPPYYNAGGGRTAVYDISAGSFSQVGGNVTDSGWTTQGQGVFTGLGPSISDDGNSVSIGSSNITPTSHSQAYPIQGEEDAIQAQVFEFTGTTWAQKGATLTGTTDSDRFGWRTSLSGDGSRLAVGAPHGAGDGTQRGYVRVFSWTGSAWSQMGSDVTGVANYDYFGWSVQLSQDGSRLVVGARGDDGGGSNAGTARVFDWTGSAWQQVGGDIDGEAANDFAASSGKRL